MTKRMLIDASHTEETRVVVLDGNRLEEFDLEAATRRPLKGNIYLAKVVRVEPSLQAAFVEYGGNRHGFLAFSEIHPDYYQIPVADRQRLLEMQAAEAREEEEEEDAPAPETAMDRAAQWDGDQRGEDQQGEDRGDAAAEPTPEAAPEAEATAAAEAAPLAMEVELLATEPPPEPAPAAAWPEGPAPDAATAAAEAGDPAPEDAASAAPAVPGEGDQPELSPPLPNGHDDAGLARGEESGPEEAPPETIGGEGPEEVARERRMTPRFMRHYKIQEVIKRRQIMLVQVVKEERGTKGAALTTYISLAGRFSVLMPNSPRGGGVSRKITSATDRRRLREVIDELSLPQGMSLIVRTAGAQRPKPEIRRDCEYLLRLWDNIRDRTLQSTAPALIYEEADLIKRSIRDVFSRDVEEILVDGEDAYREAREFMRMLMPQHARKIQLNRDGALFARHQVEAQLDAMHSPTVQLRSGGYIVINQTEALVAIDVNSGRSTRERHIEDTALRTNLEAADEIARQLRLRDLAGLIVIDFIDMESTKHDAMVERRLKEALRFDRARIQVGRISHFGLLEMSRQRLRPSLTETTFVACPHCQGRGQVRSIESSALQVLRAIEEEGARRRAAEIAVHVASQIALYLLNRKRDRLAQIEARFGMAVVFEPDDTLMPPALRLERLRAADPGYRPAETVPAALRMDYAPEPEPEEEDEEEAAEAEEEAAESQPSAEAGAQGDRNADGTRRKRRRRRRRGGAEGRADGGASEEGSEDEGEEEAAAAAEEPSGPATAEAEAEAAETEEPATAESGEERQEGQRRRRRSRRGGRGAAPRPEGAEDTGEAPQSAEPPAPPRAAPPRYVGPTPADPFAGQVDDILAAMEAAEAAAEAAATSRRARPPAQPEPRPESASPSPLPVTEATLAAAAEPVPAAPPEPPPAEAAMEAPAEAPQAEAPPTEAPPALAEAPEPAPAAPGPETAAEAGLGIGPPIPVEAATPEPAEQAASPEPLAIAPPPAPEPEPEPAAAEAPAPEPAGPVQGPQIQPKLVDAVDEAAPKRRGWWKR